MSNLFVDLLNSCIDSVQTRLAQPCLLCGARSHAGLLCRACADDLAYLPEARCPVCALPSPQGAVCGACLKRPPAFDRTQAAFIYAFPLSVLVQELKYAGRLAIAAWLADRLAVVIGTEGLPDVILPMPLHQRRLNERGFNQAALISGRLATRLGVPLDLGACRRIKATRPQVGLPDQARRGNLRGAFMCERDLSGMRVALVDDVMTSGASVNELAKVVRRAGAAQVTAWVVARTVKS